VEQSESERQCPLFVDEDRMDVVQCRRSGRERNDGIDRVRSAGRPIVLMVPSWDDVFGYQALADALPPGVAAMALACTSDDAVSTVSDFVNGALAMAVDAVTDRGQVSVLGWSVGGVVAVELAAALVEAGIDVDHVALVDTLYPGEGHHLWSNRWWKYKSLLTPKAAGEVVKELRAMVQRRVRRARAALGRRVARFSGDEATPDVVSNAVSGVFPAESLDPPLGSIELPVVFTRLGHEPRQDSATLGRDRCRPHGRARPGSASGLQLGDDRARRPHNRV
jgi:hypothetical protein